MVSFKGAVIPKSVVEEGLTDVAFDSTVELELLWVVAEGVTVDEDGVTVVEDGVDMGD